MINKLAEWLGKHTHTYWEIFVFIFIVIVIVSTLVTGFLYAVDYLISYLHSIVPAWTHLPIGIVLSVLAITAFISWAIWASQK